MSIDGPKRITRALPEQSKSWFNAITSKTTDFVKKNDLAANLTGRVKAIGELGVEAVNNNNFKIAGYNNLDSKQQEKLTEVLHKSLPGFALNISQEGLVSVANKAQTSEVQTVQASEKASTNAWSDLGAKTA
jgi:molybdopterin biosynthesis enzyme MoaB